MNQEIFDTLEKIALSNPADIKMAASIVRRGKVVSFGMNSRKSHPLQAKYGKNEESIFLHAEISAIKNALREIDVDELSKCDLYILRLKKTKPFAKKWVHGLARPCPGCERAIREFDIKRVFYTTDEGTYGEL